MVPLTTISTCRPPQRRLVTGVQKLGPGRLEVLQVAEAIGGLDQAEREQRFVQLLAKVEK